MGNTKSKSPVPDGIDGVQLHSNVNSPHRPGTADPKKKKKTAPKFIDGEKVDVLNSWVSQNIRKKECVTFIPQVSETPSDGDKCGCGHTRHTHFKDLISSSVEPGTVWDPHKHVREFPSDAHGDLTFTGTTRTWAKYVRASNDTPPRLLFNLLTQQWDLSVPNLLISVTGGAKNFKISPRLKTEFSRGLVTAAQSTGAWIITGGSHAGVMKHVGEAVRDFSGGQHESDIVLIGIATWGIVHNREALISEAGGAPAVYQMDEGSQGSLCCLDNNHTHFILVDNGTCGKYGVEIPLRAKLEKYISAQTMEKAGTAIKIPIVCVVLEGGPGTLDTIYNSMCNNTPCVIVEGSGRVADIIAQVAHLRISRITISLVKEKLQNLFQDTYENFTEAQITMWTKKIQDIVRMGSLLTILRDDKTEEQGMDVAILQALLKASRSTDNSGQENWDHQLKLAVAWNRPDIAESQIFTEDWLWKTSDLYASLMVSLVDDKPSFLRLFLERGVSLSEFLTWDVLTELYNNTEPSSLIHSKLERQAMLDESTDMNGPKIQLHHVSRVLQELLGGLTEPLYPDGRSHRTRNLAHINIKISGKVSSMKLASDCTLKLEHPVRDLLIWCIVQNRAELAEIIWCQSQDCIVGALACRKILKALSKEEDDTESMENMKKLADVYEERAAGVFSECYESDESRAEQLLIRVSSIWGKTTCLDLAQESQGQAFMSQGGVQMFLNKTWCGKLSVDNGLLAILLCMLLFPLIYTGLVIYRKEPQAPRSSRRMDTNGQMKSPVRSSQTRNCLRKFLHFFTAPIVKFYYNVVSYVGFLWLFAYVLMMNFQTYPSWSEYILYGWVFAILCEELRQLLYDPDRLGFVVKSVQYISEFWNQIDSLALVLFAVGLICRLASVDTVYLGRIFLSIDFMIFCVRLLHIFTVSKVLGPKIIMLRRMVMDLFFFFFLLAIWIISYGVAKQAILTSNEIRLNWIFRNVVYGPYLTLFGQMPSDIDGLNFDPTKCSQDGTSPLLPKCVYNDGSGNVLFPEWLTIILMCIYLLMANILLMNLLIAIFSNTFGDVESHTDQIWKFYRFGLIKEYNERPAAPPPFILLSHFYFVLKYGLSKRSTTSHKAMRCIMDEAGESSLLSWELYMRDNYVHNQQLLDAQSQENVVKNTADSVSAVLKLLNMEKGSDGQNMERRLYLLEDEVSRSSQQLQWIVSALQEKGFTGKGQMLVRDSNANGLLLHKYGSPLIQEQGSKEVHSKSQDLEEKASLGSDSLGDKKSVYHVNSRTLQYPNSNVTRYPVPDEMVPWEVTFPGYDPPFLIADRDDRGPYDPHSEMSQTNRKYNGVDGALDLRSSCGTYLVQHGLPLNPMGRTGLRGVGSLRWFGPNHSLHPVITRWNTRPNGSVDRKISRKMLEILVVKQIENELWALPGGTLSPGEEIPSKLQSILNEKYVKQFSDLLRGGTEVFRGYLDDPRNTDNSWIETRAVNIHLDSEEKLSRFLKNVNESSFGGSLRWQILDHKIPIYADEKEILQRTAELHSTHY